MIELSPLPATFADTRDGLHALAEWVIAPLRYYLESHIGLRPTPFGFGTEMLPPGDRQIRVSHGRLVDWTLDGERQDAITTLAEAAAFLDWRVEATDAYLPTTDGDPHRPLRVDPVAADALGTWFTYGAEVLHAINEAAAPDDWPTPAQLWPEHFDLAMEIGPDRKRVNVGASPGDADHPEPYLYVGPWGDKPASPVWNESFGASLSYADLLAGADPLAFVTRARAALG